MGFAGYYGAFVLVAACLVVISARPNRPTISSSSGFTLMTYNIRSGNNMANVFNLTGTAYEISSVMPDVVTLQEVDNMTLRHPVDEVAYLSSHTGMKYSEFAPWRPFEGGQYGIAVLSRHPILEVRRHKYVNPNANPAEPSNCLVQRPMDFCQGILAIKIAPPTFPKGIWIITTHISADGAQFEEAQQLVGYVTSLLKNSSAPDALVTGDFNEPPTGQGPSYLAKHWIDSFHFCFHEPRNPHGFTFNSDKPDRRIDYIWGTNPEIAKCRKSWTKDTQSSDHLPYIGKWASTA